jgi:hypothetical protein
MKACGFAHVWGCGACCHSGYVRGKDCFLTNIRAKQSSRSVTGTGAKPLSKLPVYGGLILCGSLGVPPCFWKNL